MCSVLYHFSPFSLLPPRSVHTRAESKVSPKYHPQMQAAQKQPPVCNVATWINPSSCDRNLNAKSGKQPLKSKWSSTACQNPNRGMQTPSSLLIYMEWPKADRAQRTPETQTWPCAYPRNPQNEILLKTIDLFYDVPANVAWLELHNPNRWANV